MSECRFCGENDTLSHDCKYCNRNYCTQHILPENHDCPGLHRSKTLGPEFRSEDSDSIFDLDGTLGILGGDETKESPEPKPATPEYDKSPDVERDGSIAKNQSTDSNESRRVDGRIPKVLEGATAGKRYKGDCPNCGNWVSKRGTDRFTRCHRCGWKAGLPILRIATHWPNWYLWRRRAKRWTKRGIYASALAFIFAFIVGATVGTGIAPVDNTAGDFADSSGVAGFLNNSTSGISNAAPETDSGINQTEIEYQAHHFINQKRAERGLSKLEFDSGLQEIARYHSSDMATEGYFAHESPSGETMQDRYSKHGYDCQVPISGNQYATGSENIAYTYANSDVVTDRGVTVDHDGNETSIARGLVNGWMNSTGHRKNILKDYWRAEGIGVTVTEVEGKTRVYATQNFC